MFKFSSSKKKRESQQGTGAVHTTAGRSTHTEINALHEKIAALTLANITMKNEMSALESELSRRRYVPQNWYLLKYPKGRCWK